VAAAWDDAWAADRPVVLNAFTDPNVPPLPPHVTLKQARAFVASLATDPERGSVLRNAVREVADTILPVRG
jgi:pyruvate dehydrogenase (quinone)